MKKSTAQEKVKPQIAAILGNIKALRAIRGLSQEVVAERLGVVYSTYGKIEGGISQLRVDMLFELATIFQVDLERLLQGVSNESANAFRKGEIDEPKIRLEIPLQDSQKVLDLFKTLLESKSFNL